MVLPQSRGSLINKAFILLIHEGKVCSLPGKPNSQLLEHQGCRTTDALSISSSCKTLEKVIVSSYGEGDKGVNFTKVLCITAVNDNWIIIKGVTQIIWGSPQS